MDITRRAATISSFSLLAGAHFSKSALADVGDGFRVGQGLEDFWLATDAYIFGYPLVTMEMTRRIVTNVVRPEGTRGPMGAASHAPSAARSRRRLSCARTATPSGAEHEREVEDAPGVRGVPEEEDGRCVQPVAARPVPVGESGVGDRPLGEAPAGVPEEPLVRAGRQRRVQDAAGGHHCPPRDPADHREEPTRPTRGRR